MVDWARLVREEGPHVWQVAYRLLGNHADAADCVQEVFTKGLELSRRQTVTNWGGLLRHLATVQGLHRLRCRYRKSAQTEILPADCSAHSAEPGPVERAETAELTQALRQALTELSEQEASVFCLRFLDDLSYQEIAGQLQIEVNAVGVTLHRARARLRELLAGFVAKTCEQSSRGPTHKEENKVRR
jgi:RNA polymerase sigma-70 factor, ECF subfamily